MRSGPGAHDGEALEAQSVARAQLEDEGVREPGAEAREGALYQREAHTAVEAAEPAFRPEVFTAS